MLSLLRPLALASLGLAAQIPWHETVTEHYVIKHENEPLPAWFVGDVERMHASLRRDLAMFASWMLKERLTIYLYKDQASYRAGAFRPPAWSEAIAQVWTKTLATWERADRYATMGFIAHETSHMAFHGYWASFGSKPPSWLDEGLAELVKGSATAQSDSRWLSRLDRAFAVGPFVRSTPRSTPADRIEAWYAQAYSMVAFLYRKHSQVRFKKFCAELREGVTLEDALYSSYRYDSLAHFERAWRSWAGGDKGPGADGRVRANAVKAKEIRSRW